AAGPGRLARRALAPREARIFLKLVGAIERRKIEGSRQARADAEAIDRRLRLDHGAQFLLVYAAACEDRHIAEPARVEDLSHAPRKRDEIAAVDAHAGNGDARIAEPPCERDDLAGRRL